MKDFVTFLEWFYEYYPGKGFEKVIESPNEASLHVKSILKLIHARIVLKDYPSTFVNNICMQDWQEVAINGTEIDFRHIGLYILFVRFCRVQTKTDR